MVLEADRSSHRDFLLGDPTGLGETEDLLGERQPLEAVVRMPGGRGRMVTLAIGLGLGWAEVTGHGHLLSPQAVPVCDLAR